MRAICEHGTFSVHNTNAALQGVKTHRSICAVFPLPRGSKFYSNAYMVICVFIVARTCKCVLPFFHSCRWPTESQSNVNNLLDHFRLRRTHKASDVNRARRALIVYSVVRSEFSNLFRSIYVFIYVHMICVQCPRI